MKCFRGVINKKYLRNSLEKNARYAYINNPLVEILGIQDLRGSFSLSCVVKACDIWTAPIKEDDYEG